ncbi:MAG: (2Fe-2S)-binding protein [Planctomycetota bacterium]|jgi:aerobic-type carbon monoxide dehydrogenase small subunit (CoxS/CutS family)
MEDRQSTTGNGGPPPLRDEHHGVSRRSFLQTLGLSAAAAPLAEATAQTRPDAVDRVPIHGPGPIDVTLRVNGVDHETTIEPATTLLEALRVHLNHTGAKEICDRGSCGGCSVLVDGTLTASCMTLAVDALGSEITTIEGLGDADALDPIQEAFVRHDALQCGYCTPGLIVAARALLNENPKPTLDEIKRGLSGNLCRCGAYTNILNAVLDASGQTPIQDGGGGLR